MHPLPSSPNETVKFNTHTSLTKELITAPGNYDSSSSESWTGYSQHWYIRAYITALMLSLHHADSSVYVLTAATQTHFTQQQAAAAAARWPANMPLGQSDGGIGYARQRAMPRGPVPGDHDVKVRATPLQPEERRRRRRRHPCCAAMTRVQRP